MQERKGAEIVNARQKAKKYKKQMELYKSDAELLKRIRARENFEYTTIKQRIKPLRIAQILPDFEYLPQYAENRAKELIAQKIGEFLIANKLVYFEISDAVSFMGDNPKKITATLTVLEPIERGGVNEEI
jgi:hypothetical protein